MLYIVDNIIVDKNSDLLWGSPATVDMFSDSQVTLGRGWTRSAQHWGMSLHTSAMQLDCSAGVQEESAKMQLEMELDSNLFTYHGQEADVMFH